MNAKQVGTFEAKDSAIPEAGTFTGVAYMCGHCGILYPLKDYGGRDALSMATSCCDPKCSVCGERCSRGWTLCMTHRKEREEAREKARFEKAEKIELGGYAGAFVYIPGAKNEGYVATDDVEDELVAMHHDGRKIPAWGWATNKRSSHFDLEDALRNYLVDEHHEDAWDWVNVTLLRIAGEILDQATLEVASYWEDESRAIVLPSIADIEERAHT